MVYNLSDLLPEAQEPPVAVLYRRHPRRNAYMGWDSIGCSRGVCRGRVTDPGSHARPATDGTAVEPEREPAAVADCIGLYCPVPIAMTKEALPADPAAEEDIRLRANRAGHEGDGAMRFSVRKMK
ncbi:hypothetical protein DSECCO2_420930 [anaerobic digester metagenome]|uniref:Uncharacterized protein n=1 Tax=Methanoculleus marisnigri (strain ATCC 35101 / DSM 1498 / JR1) TaxID=368407 RepID=A3CXH1_METMJ|nr:hypothetical protein Memar_2148 [Methanoculleus marisnigri JR1]